MADAYRGGDRRAAMTPGLGGARRAALGAVTGAGVVAVAVARGAAVQPLLLAACCLPLLVTAVLLLCAWRVGGRAATAHAGVAAALAGGAGPAAAWLLTGVAHPAARASVTAASLLTSLLLAALTLRAAARGPAVQTDLRPGRALATGSCLVLAAGATVAALGIPTLSTLPALAGPTGPTGLTPVTAGVAMALGAGGGAALAAASACLRTALAGQQLRGLAALAALQRYRAEASDDRVRRHDARSALAAVRAAATVATPGTELTRALRAELSRVERLLAGAPAPGSGTVPPGTVDVRDAVRPVVTAWRARGLAVDGPGDGPPALALGDADAVGRLLSNLLDNASRHAPGSSVRLTLTDAEAGAGRVVLTVDDDGPGVPPPAADAVFEPGARLHQGALVIATEPHPAAGLGLASARALAEADGGSLRLLPSPSGARFELQLPAAAPAALPRAVLQ